MIAESFATMQEEPGALAEGLLALLSRDDSVSADAAALLLADTFVSWRRANMKGE